ncbi:MAG: two-component sensor histidine kinase [Maribacter sp.]|jgi:two-component sensor histidine kinase
MKTFIYLRTTVFIFALLFVCALHAQDIVSQEHDFFKEFKELQGGKERSKFFFETPNRYTNNSAYDWLDSVNGYLNTSQKTNDSIAVINYQLIQSQIYYDLGDYEKSLAITKSLYDEHSFFELEIKTIILELMDTNYSKLELYERQFEIRSMKRELGLTENIMFYDIYSNLGQYRKAMKDYIAEQKSLIEEGDFYARANYNNNVGNYLRLDKSVPTALSYFKKANAFMDVYFNDILSDRTEQELIAAHVLKGKILGNIGKCHVLDKDYKKAISFLEESVETINKYNKGKFSSDLIENSLELAESYLQLNDFAKATDYLSEIDTPRKAANILKKNSLYAAYYDRTGDYKSSSTYLKRNVRIRDSIEDNNSKIINQQLTSVLNQNLENSRNMLEKQKLALEKSRIDIIEKDKSISLVFISLVFTLLGFAGLVYAYLKSIKNQRLIAEQKHIIENALVEKDSLLKEIHHRVKNNLQMVSSLLSLQTKNTQSKAVIEALEEGKSRVKAMALIHQKLYQNDDLSVIEMQSYIESLINSVQSVYKKGGHNINITIDAEGVELDIDRAIPFGLILNELVSNSFKYAFPNDEDDGKIYIHIRQLSGQEGFFEYTDNGVGLPEDTKERANSSMGIRLMNRLANQLQTNLNTDRTADGVRFWFNFK